MEVQEIIYKEEVKDLFSVPEDYYLTHCISADFGMGKGIVVEFNKRFNMKQKVTELYPDGFRDQDGCYEPIGCVLIDRVFNLITKKRYFDKPTYYSLEGALYFMREICQDNGIKKVAMPVIGCGLDRLQWDKVSEIIKKTFSDLDIEILVCKQE